MQIKVLGTGCLKCKQLEANARQAVEELAVQAEVIKVTDLEEIMEYVMVTPALVLDEEVKVSGRLASPEEIKTWIQRAMA